MWPALYSMPTAETSRSPQGNRPPSEPNSPSTAVSLTMRGGNAGQQVDNAACCDRMRQEYSAGSAGFIVGSLPWCKTTWHQTRSYSAGPWSAQREGRPLSWAPSAAAVAEERRSERCGLTCIACHGQPASDRADTGHDYLEEDSADDRRSCNGRDWPPTAYWLSCARTQPHR